eukprot:CAMPEP_0170492056 /NCGR_PEP_ID=MMETSP0208-20121228/11600_1 /TAXON_ID=197538 /ORGANISM="Strombidium inclinatum, Strain S3" /LENGTH=48 /DNA_ID= /DNA_START= /DNA_END= /DNA_ORIENTATION=
MTKQSESQILTKSIMGDEMALQSNGISALGEGEVAVWDPGEQQLDDGY